MGRLVAGCTVRVVKQFLLKYLSANATHQVSISRKKVIKEKIRSAWNLFFYILGALQWVKNYYIQVSSAKSVTLFERPSLCQKLPSLPLSGKRGFAERARLRKWVAVPATVGQEDEFGGERNLKKKPTISGSESNFWPWCNNKMWLYFDSIFQICSILVFGWREWKCGRDQISADCPNVGRFTYLFFIRILDKELHEGYQMRMKAGE